MEENLKKKKRRNIIIVCIILVLAVITLSRTTFKVADYGEELSAQIRNSERILTTVETGNDNGMYSDYEVKVFKNAIEKAEETLEKKDAERKELKAAYKEIKEAQNTFQQAENKDVVTAEEMKKIKGGKEPFKRTVTLGEEEAEWKIMPAEIKEEEPFNPAVKPDKAYQEEIKRETENLKKNVTSVAVLHNGKMPCTATFTMNYESKIQNIQIYRYDTEKKTYGNLIRGDVKDNRLTFPVSEGGIYVIIEDDVKNVKKVNEVLEKETDKVKKEEEKKTEEQKNDEKPSESKTKEENSSQSSGGTSESSGTSSQPAVKEDTAKYCTIEIRCDTIADQSKITNDAIRDYVPSSGVILGATKIKLEPGDTAYDVLLRAGSMYGIPVSASYSALYNSAYVEGINHIFEFDGGQGSGWMYKVNGWFPNYGCSNYIMEEGDVMVWCYTCNLGKDVGGEGALG